MRIIGASLLAAVVGFASGAGAVTMVPYSNIIPGIVEDFEGYEPGTRGGAEVPGPIGGGVGSSGQTAFEGFNVETNFAWWPLISDGPQCQGQCLEAFVSPLYSPFPGTPTPEVAWTFSNFAPETVSFALALPGPYESLSVIVEGTTTGLGYFPADEVGGPTRLAFHAADGLERVIVAGPRSVDDIIVSPYAPIPLPPAGAALLLALVALAWVRGRPRG